MTTYLLCCLHNSSLLVFDNVELFLLPLPLWDTVILQYSVQLLFRFSLLWGYLHADSWLLYCCYFFCSNATSTCMGAWSSYTFNDVSCRIQFENAIAISSPSCSTRFGFLVAFLANVSAVPSSCKLHHSLNNLLFVCEWEHHHSNFDFTIDLLCGRYYTCFHQDTVRKISIQVLLFRKVE